jgi:inositol hexakisphosphate/diphosphoinositol-pentakisphosphate kinase
MLDLTQITFELYERIKGSSENLIEDFSLRIGLSQGAHDANLIDLQFDNNHCLSVSPRRYL